MVRVCVVLAALLALSGCDNEPGFPRYGEDASVACGGKCANGATCDVASGKCVSSSSNPDPCGGKCGAGTVCVDGDCVSSAHDPCEGLCSTGTHCESGYCVPNGTSLPDGGVADTTNNTDSSSADTGLPPSRELCNGIDDNGNGLVDEGWGVGNPCSVGKGACLATGTIICDGPYATKCSATPGTPTPEVCDGIDNDCNGLVDDGLANCACVPTAEVCDGLDNDCDGLVDEDFPELGSHCSSGVGACHVSGVRVCDPSTGGISTKCSAIAGMASVEVCNGIDDDCDGVIDNGNPGGGFMCSTGKPGVCSQGTTQCTGGAVVCVQNRLASPEVCDGLDNDCNGVIDEGNPGGGGSCNTGKQGVCSQGVLTCTGGVLLCLQVVQPSLEVCDGVDNNCNGTIDEGCACINGAQQQCYDGPAGTAGVGLCKAGSQNCVNGRWGLCAGQVLPSLEVCDGLDNDCNGVIDNAPSDANKACITGLPGVCSPGLTQCVAGALSCKQNVQATLGEVCDGLDNNCDGRIDEGCACTTGATQPCYSGPVGTAGVGVCKAGISTCVAGAWGVCVGEVLPSAEICDGKDNDCDGTVDNGNPGGGATCSTGKLGVCGPGTTACTAGVLTCVQNVLSSAEVCDGKDNNCDGVVDEGCQCVNGQTQPCYDGPAGTSGVGLCKAGSQTCVNGRWGLCAGQILPSLEVCDGLDNDCNGVVDNNPADSGKACVTGLPGVCSPGLTLCVAGALTCHQNVVASLGELCDGLDNNCNGQIDEGCACTTGATQQCYDGPVGTAGIGVCKAGTSTCVNGTWGLCAGQVLPSAEICDGKDNDCDGTVDNGNPGVGMTCSTGKLGVCGPGTTACTAGVLTCIQNILPSAEVCDGKDNNCDGTVDEGCQCVNGAVQACYDGPNGTSGVGLCKAGTQTCVNGHWGLCAGQILPALETCDGLDNDCNGVIDNAPSDANKACITGLPGVCGPGLTLCVAGALTCHQNVQATLGEVCDGLDNNCDGRIDEGCACTTGATQPCYSGPVGTAGIGQCKAGITTCVNGSWGVCVGEVIPSAEICDGKDNDCDGTVDNGNPGGGMTCSTGKLGVCGPGTTACTAGVLVCNQNVLSSVEVCDGKDNNCDGTVDEGCQCINGQTQACYDGPAGTANVGLCRAGTQTCVSGHWGLCAGQVLPAPEICDGLDNDCNGVADNGNPGGGLSCQTGLLGVCSSGSTQCVVGGLTCRQTILPSPEVCDGLDNNCNGSIDEGGVCVLPPPPQQDGGVSGSVQFNPAMPCYKVLLVRNSAVVPQGTSPNDNACQTNPFGENVLSGDRLFVWVRNPLANTALFTTGVTPTGFTARCSAYSTAPNWIQMETDYLATGYSAVTNLAALPSVSLSTSCPTAADYIIQF